METARPEVLHTDFHGIECSLTRGTESELFDLSQNISFRSFAYTDIKIFEIKLNEFQ